MEVTTSYDYLLLNQKKYVQELLLKVGILEMSTFSTPMIGNCLTHTSTDIFHDETIYRSTFGTLQHICVTRPHIHFNVYKLNWYMQSPIISHWKAVLHVLRYLKGILIHGLLFRTNPSPTNDISLDL